MAKAKKKKARRKPDTAFNFGANLNSKGKPKRQSTGRRGQSFGS